MVGSSWIFLLTATAIVQVSKSWLYSTCRSSVGAWMGRSSLAYTTQRSTPKSVVTMSAAAPGSAIAAAALTQSTLGSPSKNRQNILAIVPSTTAKSTFATKPFQEAVSWFEVMNQVAEKVAWEAINNPDLDEQGKNQLEDLKMNVITLDELQNSPSIAELVADVVLLIGLSGDAVRDNSALQALCSTSSVVAPFACEGEHFKGIERYGEFTPHAPMDRLFGFWDRLYKTKRRQHRTLHDIANEMWARRSTGDIIFMVLVLVDAFSDISIKSVKSVTSSESTGLDQVQCMCVNCGSAMVDCFKSENCRKALNCLENCRGNDQVCSYRCITSYETPEFEKFALCILQKHNCMGNTAKTPIYPDPMPMTTFRGQPLTHEVAEDIFIGHLKPREGEINDFYPADGNLPPWSWKVVCGQNPAYDYFSCQHQIFYRDKKVKSAMWYDPVFQVTTLDGHKVWRRRHYRVRRGSNPGQFFFSVSDNGVTSKEFWRIVDCADDLSWAVFYYGGSAAAAGTSYTGALVVTNDGRWPQMTPDSDTAQRISKALDQAGIKMWELFEVHNDNCGLDNPAGPPPLGIE